MNGKANKVNGKANEKTGAEDRKIVPMRTTKEEQPKWLRAKAAMEYFHVGRQTLNRIARECDAIGKFGDKILIYDVRKIERYIRVR